MLEIGFIDDYVTLLVKLTDDRRLGFEVIRLLKTEFSSLLVAVSSDVMWTFYLILVMFFRLLSRRRREAG